MSDQQQINAEPAAGQSQQSKPPQGGARIVAVVGGKDGKGSSSSSTSNIVGQRYAFEYNGQQIYTFEQTLDEVTIYVIPPPFVTSGKQVKCEITSNHLKLGLINHNSWFLNEDTYDIVDTDESTWCLEDVDDDDIDNEIQGNNKKKKVIVIYLIKAHRGKLWDAALKGRIDLSSTNIDANSSSNTTATSASTVTMDPLQKEETRKRLLLERFQEEHGCGGFDFSNAEINGSVPDAREFMGGVQYR